MPSLSRCNTFDFNAVMFCFQIKGHQRVPSDNREFRERTKQDAQIQLKQDLDGLLQTANPERQGTIRKEFSGFQDLFQRFLAETGPSVDWSRIEKLPGDAVRDYSTLQEPSTDSIRSMLDKLVVIKLNGGLGMSGSGCLASRLHYCSYAHKRDVRIEIKERV